MTSLLETRLKKQIDEAQNPIDLAINKAELGCYWARIGDFEKAEAIKSDLRSSFGLGEIPKVSILIILLEGLLHFFKDLNPQARDRVLRAQFLSQAFSEYRLLALNSAWLAHINFNLCRYEEMAKSVQVCIANLAHDDGSAKCRLSLLLGDAFLCCREKQASQAWYEKARQAYATLGDQASIGAITYNRAAINSNNARLVYIAGEAGRDDLRTIDREISSAFNWQALVNLLSLDHLLHLARVSLLMIKQDFQKALDILDLLFDQNAIPKHTSQYKIAFFDRMTCCAELGLLDRAQELIDSPDNSYLELEFDDRAIVLYDLGRFWKLMGRDIESRKFEEMSRDALRGHFERMQSLLDLIMPFERLPELRT